MMTFVTDIVETSNFETEVQTLAVVLLRLVNSQTPDDVHELAYARDIMMHSSRDDWPRRQHE